MAINHGHPKNPSDKEYKNDGTRLYKLHSCPKCVKYTYHYYDGPHLICDKCGRKKNA